MSATLLQLCPFLFFAVLNGFPPKELIIENINQSIPTLSIKSGDTLIVEENKSLPAMNENQQMEEANDKKVALSRQ